MDTLIPKNVILKKEELLKINGGSLSSTVLNSISRLISTFVDLGKSVGSAIRRATSGNICPL